MVQQSQPSLKINAISNWTVLAVNIAIQFFLTPFIIRHLGKTNYGIWLLIWSFVGCYGLLDLGVGSAMTRYLARYAGQRDEKSLNETASTAMSMFCLVGGVVIVIGFLVAAPLARFFNVTSDYFIEFQKTFRIISMAIGLSFPAYAFSAVIRAHEKFVALNLIAVVIELVKAGLTVLLLMRGYGMLGAAAAILCTEFVRIPSNFLLYRCLTPSVRIRFALARIRVIRLLITYGSVTTVIVVADMLRISLDSFVVGKCVSLSAVGVYGIAASIIRYVVAIVCTGLNVLTPRFAALDGQGDHAQLRRLVAKSLSVAGFLSFGAYMMAIIFGKQFIVWWIGPDFSQAATILWILSISYAFAVSQNPSIGLMYALNKHYLYAIATAIEAVANLTLSIILVLKYGMVGVALGTMIPMLVVKILVMPVYVSKLIDMTIGEYIKPMLPSAIVASVIVLSAYVLGIMSRENETTGHLLCSSMMVGFLYVVATFLVIRKYNPILALPFARAKKVG